MKTQNERLIEYLCKFESITQIEALNEIGIMRLASRISELKKNGYSIESKDEIVKNRYGEPCRIKRYWLKQETL